MLTDSAKAIGTVFSNEIDQSELRVPLSSVTSFLDFSLERASCISLELGVPLEIPHEILSNQLKKYIIHAFESSKKEGQFQ